MNNIISSKEIDIFIVLKNVNKDLERLQTSKSISDAEKWFIDKLRSDIEEYSHACLDRIEVKSIDRLLAKIRNYRPIIVAKSEADRERVILEKNDFYSLIEVVLDKNCRNCDKTDCSDCDILHVLQESKVPDINLPEEYYLR